MNIRGKTVELVPTSPASSAIYSKQYTESENYVYLKGPYSTYKYFFKPGDWVTSLPNKPPNYFAKVNNKCVQN